MIFKNNSEYIIPFVIKDLNIFKSGGTVSYVDTGVLYNYLYIDIFVKDKKDFINVLNIIKTEPCFNSVIVLQNKIKAKFIIDKTIDFFIIPIINNGYDALTKDELKDCALFWKEMFVRILCNSK